MKNACVLELCESFGAAWSSQSDILKSQLGAKFDVENMCRAEMYVHIIRGAAPSSQNAFNDTPLHAAAFKGHSDVVEVLIEAQVCM